MDAIQKASQTWGGKRNPGALNGTKKKKKKKKERKNLKWLYAYLSTISDSYHLLAVSSG